MIGLCEDNVVGDCVGRELGCPVDKGLDFVEQYLRRKDFKVELVVFTLQHYYLVASISQTC